MFNAIRILFAVMSFVAAQAYSEAPHNVGYELYSWQKSDNWNFAIFEGTTTVRSQESIQSEKNRIKGTTYLKGRIAELPSKETLYWREDKARGFRLPPRAMLLEIYNFTKSCNVKLLLPGETANSGAYKDMKGDLDQLLD